jgi:transcriptional regulator with XRE-family HTH domain
LNWSRHDLSEATGLGLSRIARFESDARTPHKSNLEAVRAAPETAGVEFIDSNGGGPGVRLRD